MNRGKLAAFLLCASLLLGGCMSLSDASTIPPPSASSGASGDGTWDAGNIISDTVFYNSAAMTAAQIQTFITGQGCVTAGCLGVDSYSWPGASVAWCQPVPAGAGSFAQMLSAVSTACGINPQVGLVIIAKESQGLTRNPPPAALTGFGCPDTGAGGSANCDAGSAGVWAQTWGMVQAFAHLHVDPSKINYPVGQTSQVYWNVAESGCGKTPVTVQNTATATLLTYTPYVPNAASLAAYPGTGDACSSYGNRNFYRMFTQWFGSTGGGKPVAAGGGVAGVAVALNGPVVTIPDHPNVVPALRGYQLTTGSAGIAKGLAAGFAQLGKPYVWGGWNDDGCGRGGGDKNSCQGVGAAVGGSFDCSGLTAYVIMQGGFPSPGDNSGAQAQSSHAVPWPGAPGDIIHFPGHVAIDLGSIGGQVYILEASDVGTPIRIVAMFRTDNDPTPYRYWS